MGQGKDAVGSVGCPWGPCSRVFVVSGPSGAGKTSLCSEVLRRLSWIRASVSHTTRPPRPGEQDGKDYHFVDRRAFERMIEQGLFLEWAEVHGYLYGSSLENLLEGPNYGALLFEVDCKGAMQIRARIPEAVLIFVLTPKPRDLIERIRKRGDVSKSDLDVRLRTARQEIQSLGSFDYLVINDTFEDAADRLCAILVSETCRKDAVPSDWLARWASEFDSLLAEDA